MKPPAFVLFVKAARPGEVKTRLVPPLTAEQACRLHRAFAQDVAALGAGLPAERYLYTNDVGDAFVADLARRFGMALRAQHPGDLGERMLDAQRALAPEHAGVVIAGGDCPTLPTGHLAEALRRASRQIVIGPAADGGYTLIGAPRPTPELLLGMVWGVPTVLRETLSRAAGAKVHLLPTWYDVDTPDALERLRAHLAGLPAGVARATRAVLCDCRPASEIDVPTGDG